MSYPETDGDGLVCLVLDVKAADDEFQVWCKEASGRSLLLRVQDFQPYW